MMLEKKDGILLESGTGEVEILHFIVAGEHYAINVIKVKELLQIENVSKVPNSHPAVSGISLIRGEMISIVDLMYVLENRKNDKVKNSMTLVCEFNKIKVGFAIDSVLGINRIGWNKIMKPDDITANSLVIGNINLNNQIIMLLDFEKIVMDINPNTGINLERIKDISVKDRSHIKVALADDSPLIRKVLLETLTSSGFTKLKFFDDGAQAYDYLLMLAEKKGDRFMEDIDLLITDIEMPQLDGHALTRRIKEHKILKKLPIIIFSSLITDDLLHKGDAVGADAQMSKPEIENLVNLIDKILKIRK
ncbi:MAG: two-component system, chemotaxis family, chemotaxis protein CheV [Clostridiales bacterium]|jgi:two-component system chemotaxis response regulator CheV|nr:two-component system, chemotaxis family, chemotaxis protein CheV [Clostridiales bacterium]MDN5298729.1 two-component system, chemotaxis family, chemotaxis protein CheV [Clostridiales bacterium]